MWKGVRGGFVVCWSICSWAVGLIFFILFLTSPATSVSSTKVLQFLLVIGLFTMAGAFIGFILDRIRFIRDLMSFIDTFLTYQSPDMVQKEVDKILTQRAYVCKHWGEAVVGLQQGGLKALRTRPAPADPDNIKENRKILNEEEEGLQRQFRSASKYFWRGYDLAERLGNIFGVALRERSWKKYVTPEPEVKEEKVEPEAKEEKKVS